MRKFLKKVSIMMTHTIEAARLEAAMVGSTGLEFSAAKSPKHGLPAFNALITAMSIRDACVSGGSKVLAFEVLKHIPTDGMPGLELPTLRWVLGMFDGVGHGRLEDACSRALDAQIRALLDRGAVPRANPVVACDTYYSPGHDRTEELGYAAPGRLGAGANSRAGFMIGAAVSGPYVISTGFCRVNRRAARAGCVARMLGDEKGSGLDPMYMVLDKEYYSVGAMIECARRGRHFLMYAVENARVKEAVEAYKRGERERVGEFTVGTGRRRFTGALVMAERARGRKGRIVTDILPLFSNMPRGLLGRAAERLPLEMERRRRMEAGHRRIEAAMPLTTSGRRSVRTYMFWRALVATNLWALVDFETKAALCAAEGKEFPPAAWSAEREPGDMDDTALPGGLDIKLEAFLSMYLTVCTRAAIMDRKEQEGYAEAADAEFRHLFEPAAEGTGSPPEPPAALHGAAPSFQC